MVSPITAGVGALAAAAYLASTALQVRSLSQHASVKVTTLRVLTGPALLAHGIVNYSLVSTPAGFDLGFFVAASLVTWIMVCFVFVTSLRAPVTNLLVIVSPIAALSLVTALTIDSSFTPLAGLDQTLVLHIALSILAYGILFMAACQSLMLAVLEDRIRNRQAFALVRLLPPLQTMESLLFTALWAGMAALTLAIATGFLFLDDMFSQRVVHHTVLALASWFVYGTLLFGHHLLGWRGTTAIRWTLLGFLLLLLGYFGSKFVIEILLGG